MKAFLYLIIIYSFMTNAYCQEEHTIKIKYKHGFETIDKVQADNNIMRILGKNPKNKLKETFPGAKNKAFTNSYDLHVQGNLDSILTELKSNPSIESVSVYDTAYPLISCTEPVPVDDYYTVNIKVV